MASPTMLTAAQLSRLVGLPDAPTLIDVRSDAELAADPRMLPGAIRRDFRSASSWGADLRQSRHVVVVCQRGFEISQGVAAWLRHAGLEAESLEGGFQAWAAASAPLVRTDHVPPRDAQGRTLWVTRARPKVDRIACPWLIRRFIDRSAVFLFVPPADVAETAGRFHATPFDVDDVFWSHRGEFCTFDIMLDEFGLHSPSLDRLALIVRGADTARPDLAPQAAGLLAVSLGLSRMHKDDLAQLEAGFSLYDAFYRWSRDAAEETHNWPTPQSHSRRRESAQ